ncbi:hypothetical protein EJB05_06856, partial [Eragrostis curvula]
MQQQPPPPPTQPESVHRRGSSACSTAPRRSIGCMAGLLRLFSPYHRSHHRKRLTAKNATKASAPQPQPPSSPPKKRAEPSPSPFLSPVKPMQPQQPAAVRRRRSCDGPRSPTIAPEHRRSSCDSPRPPPPAIVARLMGLEESAPSSPATAPRPVLPTRPPPPPPPPPASPPETAAEKRRKLLGALEKCDEDLKTLRRIIAAVRAAEMRAAAASSDVAPAAAGTPPPGGGGAKCTTLGGRDEHSPSPSPRQFPSPDSVLDAISSPRFPCRKRPSPCTDHDAGCGNGAAVPTAGTKIVKPSRTFVFSGDYYCKIKAGNNELKPPHAVVAAVVHHAPDPPVAATTDHQACTLPARLPRAAGAESWRHHRRRWELEAAAAGRVIRRATTESVGEAAWGQQGEQRWECGMVAAALERAVLQDLVGDVVSELLAQAGHGGGCRKRLCF